MLREEDIPGFFTSVSSINKKDYVLLKYHFETQQDPRLAAASLCSEQSTAQWSRPGHTEDFRTLHAAKVVSLKQVGSAYQVEIVHPHRNFGSKIPNFLSAAAGEGPFYCPGIDTIRWMDFDFPEELLTTFQGPQFGLKGLRETLGIQNRPFFIGVVKPNMGLTPKDFADIAFEGWRGGLDICKDDEMLADLDWSPLKERAGLTTEALKKAESVTGKKKMYIANITDEVDRINELYNMAVESGVSTVMINTLMTGLSSLRMVRKKSKIPLMSHFTGTACFSRIPNFGISALVLTKLQRLAGADIIGLAGFGERMKCSDREVLETIEACLKPWGPIQSCLPVPGGSDTPETLAAAYHKIGHSNFGFICGRGVFGHPEGPAQGAQKLLEAWDALSRRSITP